MVRVAMVLLGLAGAPVQGQVPGIASFSPITGPVGTTVTLTGTNFDATPSNNIVHVGGLRATVTAASATSLTITIPAGAAYAPITVTLNGLTASTRASYGVTFPGGHFIDTSAFAARVDYPSQLPYGMASGDLDGDGKPDLIVGNNRSSTLSVYRNTSDSAGIAFATQQDFAAGGQPMAVAVADVDGDGMLDVICVNTNNNVVSVFRNTSSSGMISFASRVDFATGGNPISVVVADIDGDGRPDLAVANNTGGTASVLRNTSTPGTISFAAKVDFACAGLPQRIAAGDIDGDGKPDLAIGNGNGTVSVLRNLSSSGTVAFATRLDLTVSSSSYPQGVVLTDVDGDGKPDLCVALQGGSLTVLRNTSSAGTIDAGSFAAKLDFGVGGYPDAVAVADIDGDGKPDFVLVDSNSIVSVLRNTSTAGSIAFASHVDFAAGQGPYGITVADFDGDGRPDLAVGWTNDLFFSILHNTQPALPPTLTALSATTGLAGASLTIAGSNFNTTPTGNVVCFGGVRATVTAASATSLTVTIPAGAAYAPVTVTASGLTACSAAMFLPTYQSNRVLDANSFAAHVDFAAPGGIRGIEAADFDGDGKPDLAIVGENNAVLTIYRNTTVTGSIATASFGPRQDFTTPGATEAMAVADVDGDGKLDIVVVNAGNNTVSVFRNTSSAGVIAFAPRVDYATGNYPQGVAIGDLDGDGRPEIVVANAMSNTLSVYRNTSTPGRISMAPKSDVATVAGGWQFGVAIADLDGDGRADIAVTNLNSNSVSLYRNTSAAAGTITLAARVDFAAGGQPYGVAVGDLDGDGKPDLVTANYSGTSLSVLRNTSSAGTLTAASFAAQFTLPNSSGASSEATPHVAIADIDGDGKPDLVAAGAGGSGDVAVFRNLGTPGNLTASSFPVSLRISGAGSVGRVAVADLDGDGKPDIVAGCNTSGAGTVSVLRNTMSPPPPVITSLSAATGQTGTSLTITGSYFSATLANDVVWFGAVRASVTAATATSLTVTIPSGAAYAPVTVTVNGCTAASGAPFLPTFKSERLINSSSVAGKVDFATANAPCGVAIGDVDGDGKPDIVVADFYGQAISVYHNQSGSGTIDATSLAARIDISTGGSLPTAVALADVDGDGKPDLVFTNGSTNTVSVCLNTSTPGSMSFAPKVDLPTGNYAAAVAIRDLDGDGRPDLVVSNTNDATVSVLRNTGAPGAVAFAAKIDVAVSGNPQGLALGDVDGDGKPDIVAASATNASASVLRNTSMPGVIAFAAKVDFSSGTFPAHAESVALGDLDGDGKLDLVLSNENSATLAVLRNTSTPGTLAFAAKIDVAVPSYGYSVAIGDLDGDGRPDLVAANWNSASVSVVRNTSSAGAISFAPQVAFTVGSYPRVVAVADLDGDGEPDIVAGNYSGNSISVLRTTVPIPPTITGVSALSGGAGSTITVSGSNFDPLAADDIVYFGAVQGVVTAATTTDLTVTVPVGATYAPIDLTVKGFTACTTGAFDPTVPTSGTLDTSAFAPRVDFAAGANPVSLKAADIDGDGKPDLVVANLGGNTLSVYRNTGASGSMDTGSFAAALNLTTYGKPLSVAIGDLDGDGKLDIAVVSGTGTLSVFRNTSSHGAISFAARVDFVTGSTPWDLAIGDLDGDGRPDIVVADASAGTVSVFQNTGAIGTIAFASKIDLAVGTNPSSVAIADLDGDGRAEILVANMTSNTLSVLRNLSSFGSLAFAAKVDFACALNPWQIVVGDLNGDGKADVAAACDGSNMLSVLQNTSTPGNLSFNQYQLITGNNPRSVAIGDLDGDGRPDLVSGNFGDATVSVFLNTSSSGTLAFAAKADVGGGNQPQALGIADLDGDGKADLAVADYASASVAVMRNVLNPAPVPTAFDSWRAAQFSAAQLLDPAVSGPLADPDGDGVTNLAEFAVGGNPLSATDRGKAFVLTDAGAGNQGLVLTIAVRAGTPAFSAADSPTASQDGITYTIEGGTTLDSWGAKVNVLATPLVTGLPVAGAGYEYRSFSLEGSGTLPGQGFLRVKVTQP